MFESNHRLKAQYPYNRAHGADDLAATTTGAEPQGRWRLARTRERVKSS
jgi:hypothetical protein